MIVLVLVNLLHSSRANRRVYVHRFVNLTETGNPPVILGIFSNHSQNFPDIFKYIDFNCSQNQPSSF